MDNENKPKKKLTLGIKKKVKILTLGVNQFWNNGQIKNERPHKNAKFHGTVKRWSKNGQLRFEGEYINGKSHGVHKVWFENEILKSENTFSEVKINGIQKG